MHSCFFRLEIYVAGIFLLLGAIFPLQARAEEAVSYDVVYVRTPRLGDSVEVRLPEIFDPIHVPAASDLMLLHPDGSQEVLVAGGNGAVVDPFPSFDGQWVYYAYFHDQRPEMLNAGQHNASVRGADIYKIHVSTREIVRLTFQEWTPLEGTADWGASSSECGSSGANSGKYCLGYGVFNLGPTPLPGGKIMFSSSRDGYLAPKSFTFPNLQLFVMDEDGRNVEKIGHLNVGSALHPTVLKDGRVMFSSYESQGLRDPRAWGLWAIWPDGRKWEPLLSAFMAPAAAHFQTQLSSGDIAVVLYYNKNNNGFGTIVTLPPAPPDPNKPPFGSADPLDATNPALPVAPHPLGYPWMKLSFSPQGLQHLTQFSHFDDAAAGTDSSGQWMGKVTHPAGAPGNDLLLVWSPGPANSLQRPTDRPVLDAGIYLLPEGKTVTHPSQLRLLKNDPRFNEIQPRALVPYRSIYGVDEPARLSWLPNDGSLSAELAAGTPFGLVGTASLYKRDTAMPRSGSYGPLPLSQQGGDIGTYLSSDIHAVRIVSMEGAVHRGAGPGIGSVRDFGFQSYANEMMRILGEIPVRKFDALGKPVIDVDGNPDTSFLARIPADVPFTFQTIDKDGFALNISQTWHQLRPGEIRNDCGGCHAHSHIGTDFSKTAAARQDYQIADLTRSTTLITRNTAGESGISTRSGPVDVEFYRDIKPILDQKCASCHGVNGTAEGGLVLSGPDAYKNLAGVSQGDGYAGTKYIKPFQSRVSLLSWKLFGRRTDGSTDALPGTIMPPSDSGVPALTPEEKMTFVRWMDLGAPINLPDRQQIQYTTRKWGWFADSLRPTLTISSPRPGWEASKLQTIRIGMFDYYSGLDMSTFSVKANFPVLGRAAGSELADKFRESAENVWTLDLEPAIGDLKDGLLTASVKDKRGNVQTVRRVFSAGTESPRPTATPLPTPRRTPTGGNPTPTPTVPPAEQTPGVPDGTSFPTLNNASDLVTSGTTDILVQNTRKRSFSVFALGEGQAREAFKGALPKGVTHAGFMQRGDARSLVVATWKRQSGRDYFWSAFDPSSMKWRRLAKFGRVSASSPLFGCMAGLDGLPAVGLRKGRKLKGLLLHVRKGITNAIEYLPGTFQHACTFEPGRTSRIVTLRRTESDTIQVVEYELSGRVLDMSQEIEGMKYPRLILFPQTGHAPAAIAVGGESSFGGEIHILDETAGNFRVAGFPAAALKAELTVGTSADQKRWLGISERKRGILRRWSIGSLEGAEVIFNEDPSLRLNDPRNKNVIISH